MTTKADDRPADAEVAEDTGLKIEDLTLPELWGRHEDAASWMREWAIRKGKVVQELERRFLGVHPDFKPETGGSVDLMQDGLVLNLTYDRREKVVPEVVTELALLAGANDGLTLDEYEALVAWEPKVDGNKARTIKRRGGKVADVLERVKVLTGATPKVVAK